MLLLDNSVSYQFRTILTATATFLQCFDTVGWLTQNLRPVKILALAITKDSSLGQETFGGPNLTWNDQGKMVS